MKAFHFRLDPALRWRATQLRLEKESLSRTARQIAALQEELIAKHTELRSGSSELASAGSAAFESWAAYLDRCRRRIRTIGEQLGQARKALALQTQKMVDAHRNLRVLENLRRDEHAAWTKELDREMEALAGEAFLARLARKPRAASETRGTDTSGLRTAH